MNTRELEIIQGFADSLKPNIIKQEDPTAPSVGYEDSQDCNRVDDEGLICDGVLHIEQDKCYCSATTHPPCSCCENSWIECDSCGYEIDLDGPYDIQPHLP